MITLTLTESQQKFQNKLDKLLRNYCFLISNSNSATLVCPNNIEVLSEL